MSLYIALAIVIAISLFLRLRYGSEVIRYAAAGLLLVLFLFCPTRFYDGFGEWVGLDLTTAEGRIDQLAEIVSFGLLFTAAWIAGSNRGKRSE